MGNRTLERPWPLTPPDMMWSCDRWQDHIIWDKARPFRWQSVLVFTTWSHCLPLRRKKQRPLACSPFSLTLFPTPDFRLYCRNCDKIKGGAWMLCFVQFDIVQSCFHGAQKVCCCFQVAQFRAVQDCFHCIFPLYKNRKAILFCKELLFFLVISFMILIHLSRDLRWLAKIVWAERKRLAKCLVSANA